MEVHLEDHVEDLRANILLMNAEVRHIQYMLTQFIWVTDDTTDPEA